MGSLPTLPPRLAPSESLMKPFTEKPFFNRLTCFANLPFRFRPNGFIVGGSLFKRVQPRLFG